MFETDDYDQILSQFDFPEVSTSTQPKKPSEKSTSVTPVSVDNDLIKSPNIGLDNKTDKAIISPLNIDRGLTEQISPKHTKRKIIDSYFDHKSKRKFPGPAGLLNGSFKENNDELVCHMELLSQDVDFSQNCLQKDCFDSPLWNRLLADVKEWNLGVTSSIKGIKQQAMTGSLRLRKADTVTAFIEAVDRSITDPLITLRDCTGSIKCTLHRDAWSIFSSYIVSDYCALVLWKPTVLTTGSAFKKHYLNITLSNIFAVYSSAVLNDEKHNEMPDGYTLACQEDFTVIRTDKSSSSLNAENCSVQLNEDSNGIFDGLDSIFDDEVF